MSVKASEPEIRPCLDDAVASQDFVLWALSAIRNLQDRLAALEPKPAMKKGT